MNWLILTLISALSGSLTKILQKILLTDKGSDPIAFAFVFQLTVALLFLSFTLVTHSLEIPDLSDVLLNLALMTLCYALGNILTFKAFKSAEASEVAIILSSSTAWAVLSAVIFLDESLSYKNVAGIFLILLGLLAVQYSKTTWRLQRGHLFAFFAAMLFGIGFTNDAYIVGKYQSVASYMVLAFALPALAVILFNPRSSKNIKHFLSKGTFFKLLVCGVFYAISAVAIFSAYKFGGQASIISPMKETGLILTVTLSYFLLKERDKIANKIVGAGLCFIGVLLIV